jgi:hypothetical protein
MTSRTAVVVILLLAACYGAIDGYFHSTGRVTPRAFDVPLMIALAVTAYVWYRRDSREVAYRGSTAIAGLVILLPAIGVPVYLASSRQRGKKLPAIGKCLLLVMAFVFLSSVGVGLVELKGAA